MDLQTSIDTYVLCSKVEVECEACLAYWERFPGKKAKLFQAILKACQGYELHRVAKTDVEKIRAVDVPIAFKQHRADFVSHRDALILAIQELKLV